MGGDSRPSLHREKGERTEAHSNAPYDYVDVPHEFHGSSHHWCRQTLRRGRGPESWTEPVPARRFHLVCHILYFRNALELDYQASEPGVLPMRVDFLLGYHCNLHGFCARNWRSNCLSSSFGNL